ncbi:MAG: RluA family pseudouridine synthase [Cyanobacteria bacterium REEB65]|nr:RluA family pseudouridine synthase [Cyanobacteria bacterium REEB65]
MKLVDYSIVAEDAGLAVRDVMRRRLQLSRTLYRKVWTAGKVLLDDNPADPFELVAVGQHLSLELPPARSRVDPVPLELQVVYEDPFVAVLDKPAGLVVHPTCGVTTTTLAAGLAHRYGTFHLVSRLDQETSGLLVVARDPLSAQRLTKAIAQGHLVRTYRAVAQGAIQDRAGAIDQPIARRPGLAVRVCADDGQRAITHYQVVHAEADDGRKAARSWLELRLETGRTHQIRVHLAHLGHPLLGDERYGQLPKAHSRVCLHSARVSFPHPRTGQALAWHSAWPIDLPGLPGVLAHWLQSGSTAP